MVAGPRYRLGLQSLVLMILYKRTPASPKQVCLEVSWISSKLKWLLEVPTQAWQHQPPTLLVTLEPHRRCSVRFHDLPAPQPKAV